MHFGWKTVIFLWWATVYAVWSKNGHCCHISGLCTLIVNETRFCIFGWPNFGEEICFCRFLFICTRKIRLILFSWALLRQLLPSILYFAYASIFVDSLRRGSRKLSGGYALTLGGRGRCVHSKVSIKDILEKYLVKDVKSFQKGVFTPFTLRSDLQLQILMLFCF